MTERHLTELRPSQVTRDGDGVAIRRVALVGDPLTDPLLLLDELRSPYRQDFKGGFPPHPHRGMQTLTYMKEGGIIHEDSMGNRGEIRSGGVQWMSAGSGVIHSEMPTLDTEGLHGFQLWFNLPAAEKMRPPRYRDIPTAELAVLEAASYCARVIAGDWHINHRTVSGPLAELTPQASLVDLWLAPNAPISLPMPEGMSGVAYLYNGELDYHGQMIASGQLLITSDGDSLSVQAGSNGAELLVICGHPLAEPVVGYGPFVMSSQEEIEVALSDYQRGELIKHPVQS